MCIRDSASTARHASPAIARRLGRLYEAAGWRLADPRQLARRTRIGRDGTAAGATTRRRATRTGPPLRKRRRLPKVPSRVTWLRLTVRQRPLQRWIATRRALPSPASLPRRVTLGLRRADTRAT